MTDRAVAYLLPGPTEERQTRDISRFCAAHDLALTARTTDVETCAQLVSSRLVDVVVAAVDPRNGLRHRVTIAGGRMMFVREPRAHAPSLADWLRRAIGRGVTPRQIGEAVGEDTTDVSRIMREFGIKPQDGTEE